MKKLILVCILLIIHCLHSFGLAPTYNFLDSLKPIYKKVDMITKILNSQALQKDLRDIYLVVNKEFSRNISLKHHHGIMHAKSVLHHALNILMIKKIDIDQNILIEIFLASLLHEIGMINTNKRMHGKESKDYSMEIIQDLKQQGFLKTLKDENIEVILDAVFKHDAKEEIWFTATEHSPVPKILFDADNADAFGSFGIFRYLAIYKERGWSVDDILNGKQNQGKSILENINLRWHQFDHELKPHFFLDYEKSVTFFSKIYENQSWQRVVVSVFLKEVNENEPSLNRLMTEWAEKTKIQINSKKWKECRKFFDNLKVHLKESDEELKWLEKDGFNLEELKLNLSNIIKCSS